MDDNTICYISTENNSEEIIIIMIKLLNSGQNVLLNYYVINIYNSYKLLIYNDISVFKLNNCLGIGMIHYNYSISNWRFMCILY